MRCTKTTFFKSPEGPHISLTIKLIGRYDNPSDLEGLKEIQKTLECLNHGSELEVKIYKVCHVCERRLPHTKYIAGELAKVTGICNDCRKDKENG